MAPTGEKTHHRHHHTAAAAATTTTTTTFPSIYLHPWPAPPTQHFRGKKNRYAAARSDPDASPTPDEVRSAAKAAFEPTPNTRMPPPALALR